MPRCAGALDAPAGFHRGQSLAVDHPRGPAPLDWNAQWIVGGDLLALALTLPLYAWLVDRVGAKRLYLRCFATFTLTSLLCGSASSIDLLIDARVLQGMAGGLMAPVSQMSVASVAGAILRYARWPWLFYINLPIGALALALAAGQLPADEDPARRRRFDFPGLAGAGGAALRSGSC